MKILNFGSLNIDHVYSVDHIVRPGETIGSFSCSTFAGGKGLNQSIALAHAGAPVHHAGRIGSDGPWLKKALASHGVDAALVKTDRHTATGHAIIQVDAKGENSIVLFPGANCTIARKDVAQALAGFGSGDFLLTQNEISSMPEVLHLARDRGMTVVFNPAPMTPAVLSYPLGTVGIFILNETEAQALTGASEADAVGNFMRRRYPSSTTVLTLGKEGAVYIDANQILRQPARKVQTVDTTAAGDTFIGFFLAARIQGLEVQECLRLGCDAAALCVTRKGAADSIPRLEEVTAFRIQ